VEILGIDSRIGESPPNKQALATVRNTWVLGVVCVLGILGLIAPTTAAAAGPNIELSVEQPAQGLLGTQQEVTLRASNPKGEERAYNLTFRDVLPKGVEYVGPAHGSDGSTLEPRVLEDAPNEGETTLIFENVADLSGNSHYSLTFKVEATSPEYTVGDTYTDEAGAYVNEEARLLPKFDAEGGPEPASFTGSAEDEAGTTLTAVEIKKTEPSPEQELLRGVHEHQTVYTLKLINNDVGPTSELAVDDYLPAGLEFLGCGSVDHTTEAPTDPGSPDEYPESGAIFPGNDPAAPQCREPSSVETEEVDPPGPRPNGVYTHVRWTGLGGLDPGEALEIQYRAAIPIRENTVTWPNGTPPAAGLGQAANLDNNSGAETLDEEPLTNVSTVSGRYQGAVATEDSDERTVYAEDLAVQKSVDKATIGAGQLSKWTLKLETSEYRYSNEIEIEDVLPNGLCPLGKEENYEGPTIGSPTDPELECENKVGDLPTSEYSSVQEQPNGSFIVKWNESTVEALGQMGPSSVFQITFPTHTRVDYQKNFEPEKPVLTGDHWVNEMEVGAPSFARCTPKTQDTCEGGGTTHIAAERSEGERIIDESAAEQVAGGVTIDKTVRENGGAVPVVCSEGEYVAGVEKPFPLYGPGDQICWKLKVDFNANLFSGEPVVTDFLPPEQRYVEGSIVKGPNNTVTATPEPGEAADGVIKWTINGGEAVESAKVFEFLFKTEMLTSEGAFPQDITGNLMKFSYANTEGETFPLRDLAEVERQEPELSLEKSIVEVGGKSVPKTPPGGRSTAVAGGGETVRYELDLENAGNLGAEEVEVWDVLPEGIKCEAVTLPAQTAPQAAECKEDIIRWTGVAVPIGALTTLTYEVTVPTEVAPGHAFVNHAGVTRFKSPTDTGEKFEYIPAENINAELTKANAGPLLDEAEIKTTAATLEKSATTETQQPGNGTGQATIGELVDYTVTAKIPENSKLYGTPILKDELPTNLEKFGEAVAELDGAGLPAGVTLEQLANGAEVKFGGAYPETVSAQGHTLVLTFKARVRNVAANVRGVTITNQASFEFKDVEEAEPTILTKAVGTPVVEPRLEVKKHLLPEDRSTTVEPGEIVEYETEVSDLAGSSTANEVTVTDTVPAGMKVVDAGPKGTAAGNTITWHLEAIAPGETEHLVYKLEVVKPAAAASSFTNVVRGETQSLPDEAGGVVPAETRQASFVEGAYEAAKAGYASEAKNTVKLIGATVSKEVSPTKGTIGSELSYTLHMNLPGEIKYFNTTLVDRLPDGVTFDGFAGAECKEGCSAGEELGVEVQPDGTTLIGWYFGYFEAGGPRELVLHLKAHIDDVKVGSGAEVKAPEAPANHVVGVYNETEGTKPTAVPVPGSNSFSEETNVGEATTTVAEPNVTLTKSVTAGPGLVGTAVQPSSKLTYSLTVANTGGWNAYELEVLDTNTTANLRNVTPVAGSEFVESTAGEPIVWVLPEIEAGKSMTLTYTAELPPSGELQDGEAIDNAAEVPSYFGLPEPERKEAEASREYEGPQAAKDLEVALPQIHVEKTTGEEGLPDTATAEVGKPFPWRVVVENESSVAGAEAVGVEDLLPPNWKYVAGSTVLQAVGGATVAEPASDPTVTGTETQSLTWANIAALPPETAVEVLFKATPTAAALGNSGGLLQENKAVGSFKDLTGASGAEGAPYSDEDKAFAELLEPKLEIDKTPDGDETVAGSNDKYVITVSNSGTGTAHEVEVKDVLSAGQEFVGPATANPSTGFAQKSVEANTPGPGETTVVWTIDEVGTGPAAQVEIEAPIKTLPALNDGDEVTDLATASSPQQVEEPSDPGSFDVHRETELTIEKTAVQEEVNAGEEIEYQLKVENKGPSDATGIVVTDELPEDTIFMGADPECAEAGGTIACELAEMKVGEAHTFQVTVEVESGTTEPIENKAKVAGDQPEPPGGGPIESSVVTPIGGLADLAIEKTGPQEPVLLGSEFTYEIKVENDGPSDAVNATVEDVLPSQVRFLAATTSVGTCDRAPAALLTCDLGRMLPHASATIVVSVEAAEVGAFTNVATFDSDTSPEPKEGEAPAEIVPAADLAITKTAPATVAPDGTLTYALHVENHGPSVAHKVKVTDPLPAGVDFVSAAEGCAAAGGAVTCEVAGELAVGDSVDFEVEVHVPFALGGQALTNTATVAAEEADPHVEDNSSTVTTDVGPAADLAITKTMGRAEAGKPLTYTLAVTNHGPSASSAVTVTDTLPAGTSFKTAAPSQGTCSASGQKVTCGLGPLAAGGSAQVSITVEVAATATGSLRNVATVEGPEPDPDKSNNESAVEGPIKPQDPADPNLKVVKTADTSSPAIGAPFNYRVDVTNMSGGEAKNVKVVDTLNGPVKVVSIEAGAAHCGAAGSKITCAIPRIPVGKTVQVTYSVVAEAAGPLKNTASAEAANGEKVPANNHAVKGVHVKYPEGIFSLRKTASRKVVPGGKKVGFRITLRNGAAALVDAKVCDRLPAALVFVKALGARYVNGEACWTKKNVAAHRVVRLHLVARAVMGYKSRRARNVATARAGNAVRRVAAATVRIKPAFAGEPGGVTG